MSQNTTTFGTIIDDLKDSLDLAWNNMLSYFLANLGMAVLAVLMLAIIAVPLVAIVFLTGPAALAAWGASMATWSTANLFAAGTAAFFLIAVPIIAFAFIFIGAVFGMSKEVVETGETKAESAFSWLRHNFLSFAGVGVVLSLIVVAPQLLVGALVSYFSGYVVTGWTSVGLSIFVFAYSFISLGLTSMVLPAVVNGKSVQDAVKESFRLATERFDRVFGLHTAIVGLGVFAIAPILVGAAAAAFGYSPILLLPIFLGGALWVLGAAILWIFLFLPMTYIAYTKVYHDLTGGNVVDMTPETPEISLV
ncbi:MAG: hypothetical protein ACW98Y_03095 [Candidatus Thorarchaeota archaeon]|jgi:hypothetical protein